ncbi:TMS membrane protein/tumor differentially expressed protein [Wallemia mellicola]|uniref:TMS membrane protein/tumor differentially expressed protein n=1 Tax=Wallemia mellicola TaxID=1708541 RepID=A0A4T0MC68_9BASI|nr:TMS membrane protein/tumor differentially expressed protein [Wallemia mellicola]TIC02024.1 TMS membrane protein/tumor differentially expressed protein [Wallemia mellicola]
MACLPAIPFLGFASPIISSCVGALAFCCTSTALSAMFKSCNCNSSVATRIGYSIIFTINSLLAWLMRTRWAIHALEKLTYDYLKMDCPSGKCYGVLAVHRFCFALSLFHAILGLLLVGVKDTRTNRASIQNGFMLWISFIVVSFAIPNDFFIFWSNYLALIGASIFILVGLVLLVDFAHTWSETCLDRWEDSESNTWKYILLGSTLGMYITSITFTILLLVFFTGSSCTLNNTFLSIHSVLIVAITILCIHPAVQDANPKSGLAQASMVAAYCTYLTASAIVNRGEEGASECNPLGGGSFASHTSTVVLGALFTLLAVAYSTTRAATQSKALVGKNKKRVEITGGEYEALNDNADVVSSQPKQSDNIRTQALMAAVEAGSLPASALDDAEAAEEEDEDHDAGELNENDDEKSGTKYNYSWFHVVFILAAMYVSMLLTDWNKIQSGSENENGDELIRIGRSPAAMWVRMISAWLCFFIYMWTLLAPVFFPDRFEGLLV